ncbi:hypothetical protein MHBO_005176 [Bonamia ostreae]|uniref:Phosphoglycerate mutase n=1 Tax=Bonamia ostreae TaxID=126728 RepID=A0ABV2AV87_9EUKA
MQKLYSNKVIATENARERHGVHLCDKRKKWSEIKSSHFDLINEFDFESDKDVYFSSEKREDISSLIDRISALMKLIMRSESDSIAVVTHSNLLYNLLNICLVEVCAQKPLMGTGTDSRSFNGWFEPCDEKQIYVHFDKQN